MRKGGNYEVQPAPGAKKILSVYFAPKDFPGAYELGRCFPTREDAEKVMNEYKSGKREFKFYHKGVEYSSLNVVGYYQIDEDWDCILK